MQMMAFTAALLFAVGFAGGYFVRAALSWVRRSRMRKMRAVRETEAMLKQTAASVTASPSGVASVQGLDQVAGAANA